MKRPFIWAHRGASAEAPENTLSAFALAAAYGVDGLELDVHLTHDDIPVVIHDETLDRTTEGSGAVSDWRLPDLQQLDAGGWFGEDFAGEHVPTLREVLTVFAGHLRLNLEVKDARAGIVMLALLDEFPQADVVVSSFDRRLLERLRLLDAGLPIAVLLDDCDWHRALQTARQIDAVAFHPRADRVTRPMLSACRSMGLPVYAWTVDTPAVARSLVRAGVDGLFTNTPAEMMSVLAVDEAS
jgi:glycerophosphoryl diester phosphodiesterase